VVAATRTEGSERPARGGAEHRIAANADKSGLTEARARQIETYQRAEAAAPRNHADTAGLEHAWHEGRHDADERFAWRDKACGIGADDAGAVFHRGGVHRHHIQRWNVLVKYPQ